MSDPIVCSCGAVKAWRFFDGVLDTRREGDLTVLWIHSPDGCGPTSISFETHPRSAAPAPRVPPEVKP